MEYASHMFVGERGSNHTDVLDKVELKVYRLISISPFTDCVPFLRLRCNVVCLVFSTSIFTLTAL